MKKGKKIITFCPDLLRLRVIFAESAMLHVHMLASPFFILLCTSINCQNLNDLHTKCIFSAIGFLLLRNLTMFVVFAFSPEYT